MDQLKEEKKNLIEEEKFKLEEDQEIINKEKLQNNLEENIIVENPQEKVEERIRNSFQVRPEKLNILNGEEPKEEEPVKVEEHLERIAIHALKPGQAEGRPKAIRQIDYIGEKKDYMDEALWDELSLMKKKAGLGKRLLASVMAGVQFLVLNPIKLVGAALWSIPCGIHAAYKGIESKVTGVQWNDLDHWTPRIKWHPTVYYFNNLKFLTAPKSQKIDEKGKDELMEERASEEEDKLDELYDIDATIKSKEKALANGEELSEAQLKELSKLRARRQELKEDTKGTYKEVNTDFKDAVAIAHSLIADVSKKDAKEMQAVKLDLCNLMTTLASLKDKKTSVKTLDEVSAAYEIALSSLKHYLDEKSPTFSKGKERYQTVKNIWMGFLMERNLLRMQKEVMVRDNLDAVEQTIGEILSLGEVEIDDAEISILNKENEKIKKQQGHNPDVDRVKNIFAQGFSVSENFADPGLSSKKKREKSKVVLDMKREFRAFKPGRTEVREINFYGKKMRILQKGDNSLYVIDGVNQFPLGRNAELMFNAIEGDMMQNSERYGNAAIAGLMREYKGEGVALTTGEHLRIRQNLINYLTGKLNLRREDFTNVRRTVMISYAERLIGGESVETIRNEMENAKSSEAMINGIELTEMMELDAVCQEEIREHIRMYDIQAKEEKNDWSKEEKALKNLLAESVFATDTLIMDKNADHPEEFLREVLQNNLDAVALLIKQDDAKELVSGLLNKMSLDTIEGDGKKLGEEIGKGITDYIFAKSSEDNEEPLAGIMKSATKGDAGQGLFVRKVMENYFSKMNTLDKRAMLASVLRSAKKTQNLDYSDEDIINEIKVRNLVGYDSIKSKPEKFDPDKVTKEEREQIDAYKELKNKMRLSANYLGGLIRSAGPLFQKMMQGIPEATLPVELRVALRDVKSKLPPIPERVVQSQLFAMVGRSGGTVTNIEVKKSLGAASVGQTFSCVLYGPNLPKEGRKVVIKLLRPDVQNRMMREEEVMLDCAKSVDDGMYETYKGQLANYKAELDLTKEKENINEGKVYNGKFENVESEGINELIDATVNSLVIEEAEGETLDDLLLSTQKMCNDIMDGIMSKAKSKYSGALITDASNYKELIGFKSKLVKKVNEIIKKRDIMANVCNNWISTALVGNGYYHAELHAGNILISDEKGTLIDYGNAVKFDKAQQNSITSMMVAAVVSDVEAFFAEFNKLLAQDDEFKQFYTPEKQNEVKEEFRKILNMGNHTEAGQRISAALIKASSMGVKLPPAIFNFSQGQLRLQKSINDINDMIKTIKNDITFIDSARGFQSISSLDIVSFAQTQVTKDRQLANNKDAYFDWGTALRRHANMFDPVAFETFKAELLLNDYREEDKENGIEAIDSRKDFDKKYLGRLINAKSALTATWDEDEDDNGVRIELPNGEKIKAEVEKYLLEYKDKKGTKEQQDAAVALANKIAPSNVNLRLKIYDEFGGTNYMSVNLIDALKYFDEGEIAEQLSIYTTMIPTAIRLEENVKKLREDQDKKVDVSNSTLIRRIYDDYNVLRTFKARRNAITNRFMQAITLTPNSKTIMDECKDMFNDSSIIKVKVKVKEGDNEVEKEVEKKLGSVFKEKLETFLDLLQKNVDAADKGIYDVEDTEIKSRLFAMKNEIMELHYKLIPSQLKMFIKERYNEKPDIKDYDFSKVMTDVVMNNKLAFTKNLGWNSFALLPKLMAL